MKRSKISGLFAAVGLTMLLVAQGTRPASACKETNQVPVGCGGGSGSSCERDSYPICDDFYDASGTQCESDTQQICSGCPNSGGTNTSEAVGSGCNN